MKYFVILSMLYIGYLVLKYTKEILFLIFCAVFSHIFKAYTIIYLLMLRNPVNPTPPDIDDSETLIPVGTAPPTTSHVKPNWLC